MSVSVSRMTLHAPCFPCFAYPHRRFDECSIFRSCSYSWHQFIHATFVPIISMLLSCLRLCMVHSWQF